MFAVSAIARLGMAMVAVCAAVAPIHAGHQSPTTTKSRLYIGTFDAGDRQGIYQAELDLETGKLQLNGLAGEAKNVLFLALHPSRQYLYATCEVDEYDSSKEGALASFKIDAVTGNLTKLNHRSSTGALPCHVSIDREGKHALVANYLGGNAAVLPIDVDGKLGPAISTIQHQGSSIHKVRQTGPHPHSINLDAANRFAFVADAGIDEICAYRFDTAAGTLAANDPPAFKTTPGAAPRHLAFHPNGNWAYVINELNSTVTAMRYDAARGVLETIHTVSTLPTEHAVENLTAEIIVHPTGKFLYGSNRGHDSIAIFAIDQNTGRLTPLCQHPAGGRTPCGFAIDPTARFLLSAHQDSDSIVVHQIDPVTGKLTRTSHQIKVPKPLCIKFVP